MNANLHWFEDTDLILLSNSVWLGESKVKIKKKRILSQEQQQLTIQL